jgi:hypothetical protein
MNRPILVCTFATLLGGAHCVVATEQGSERELLKADEIIFDVVITDAAQQQFQFVLRFSQLAAPLAAVENFCYEKHFPDRADCAAPILKAMRSRQLLDDLTISDMRKYTLGTGGARCMDGELGTQGRKVPAWPRAD